MFDALEAQVSSDRPPEFRRVYKSAVLRLAKFGFAAADIVHAPCHGPRILIYHQVGSGLRGQMDIDANVFRRQLDWLEANGEFRRLEDSLRPPLSDRSWVLTFDDGYRDVFDNAFPLLRERKIPFTLYLTTRNIERQEVFAGGGTPLEWNHVEEMIESGLVTVGAHTDTHPDLRDLNSDAIEEELDRSNSLVLDRVGITPDHFAYPKGYWAREAESLIRARYQTAALGAGPAITADTDPHRLPRVAIQRADGLQFFRRKVHKGMRYEEHARRLVKGYSNPGASHVGPT